MSPQGLVFVYLEAGNVQETDLIDWYENEHVPRRVTVPGITSVLQYKAADAQKPTWLTLYDVDTLEVVKSEAYTSLRALGSDNEKEILSKIGGLSRRTYAHMRTFTHPDTKPGEDLSKKWILVVGLEMTPDGEDELNKWYDEEHMDLLSKVPGWKAGKRYKLIEYNQRGELMADKPVEKYLAIHYFDNNDFLGTAEFKHATSTEWRAAVMAKCVNRTARVFEAYKNLGKSTA